MPSEVYQLGHPIIRKVAEQVTLPLSDRDRTIITQLAESMRERGLVGMAAPQIGESIRIFVTEVRKTKYRPFEQDKLRVFINPEIVRYSGEKEVSYEGCGSIADANLFGEVERSIEVEVRYLDENAEAKEGAFSGFLARVIQHEYDHLNGIVFTDKLFSTKTLMSGIEFKKLMERKYKQLEDGVSAST